MRILVVDDDELSGRALVRALRTIPEVRDVRAVGTSAAAFEVLETWVPQVAITDFEALAAEGEGLLQALAECWPSVLRVVYSASLAASSKFAHMVLIKPASIQQLRAALGIVLMT